ncbi:hypothetical protein TI05_19100 [Achromatium sp. WMS3]|nr:hypothetical protein TI05_19100 [Achromatium sp. WMS3]
MSEVIEEFESKALSLSPMQRSHLVERLIISLDTEPDIEDAWAEEIAKRCAEVDNGTVTLLPGPETLAQLKDEFNQ